MLWLRRKNIYLILSVVISLWLLVAQTLASEILLLPCLFGFVVLMVLATLNDTAMPLLLFFLPWAPLIKLAPGQISVYTLTLLLMMVLSVLKRGKSLNVFYILPALLLIGLALATKIGYDYAIDNNFLVFCSYLLLFPMLSKEQEESDSFYFAVVFFSIGIIIAALAARRLIFFPTISRFITTHTMDNTIRLSGFYGDPNFYSGQISAAIAGALILFLGNLRRIQKIILAALAILLIYCGFLSVSKSFAVVFICLIALWIVEVLFRKGKISTKLWILLLLVIATLFVLSSSLFADQIEAMIGRFMNSRDSLASLTTGRTEVWQMYINELDRNSKVLFFGHGYTKVLLNGLASHNTGIQIVFQFGLLGSVIIVAWFLCYFRLFLRNVVIRTDMLMQILLLLIGSIGPWMALDLLMFDEFFLIPFFVCSGIRFLAYRPNEEMAAAEGAS